MDHLSSVLSTNSTFKWRLISTFFEDKTEKEEEIEMWKNQSEKLKETNK